MDQLAESLEQFKKKDFYLTAIRELSSGKEAVTYLVRDDTRYYALKVYRPLESRLFKHTEGYVQGKFMRRPSERRALQSRSRFGKQLQHQIWVNREYFLLKKLFEAGALVPQPFAYVPEAVLMQYLGDDHNPAPRLKDVHLSPKQKEQVYQLLNEQVDLFWELGIVHGDLSPYNVLYWNETPYVIDFPQAIDIRENPEAEKFLEHDKAQIENWFHKK